MALTPQMTSSWKWKVAATGVTALAGWLVSPAHQSTAPFPSGANPAAVAAAAQQTAADVAAVSEVEEQARRLTARAPALGRLPRTERNPFRFQPRPAAREAEPVAPPVRPPAEPVAPAPFPLRLDGIAVDTVNGVERRTAVISGPTGLEIAGAGDQAAPGYRVISVGESWAEVERVGDGARQRLTFKP